MKLVDLYEKKVEFPRSRKAITGILKSKQLQHLGTGVQAIAYQHKKHPNTVIKTIQLSGGMNDTVLAFVRLCINHKDNPFFPKIYTAKIFNSADLTASEREVLYQDIDSYDSPPDKKELVLVLVMERLFPIHTPDNVDSAIGLLQTLKVLPDDLSTLPLNMLDVEDPLFSVKVPFKTAKGRQFLMKNSDNPKFVQALRLLEPLFRKGHADLHRQNIMIRRTGIGPQLVLADPIVDD